MLIVISPAKNLDETSILPKVRATQPQLLDQAENLVSVMKTKAPHQLSKLMSISDKLGTLNHDRYQSWQRPFTSNNARPAALMFNGDVYQGLAAGTFNKEDFGYAQSHLRILSGLYGVLRPLDLMQAYRLEMGTSLKNEKGKDLYAYWQDTIAIALNKQLKKIKSTSLINLASNEYFKAIDKHQLDAEIIEPVFKEKKNGSYKIVSFYAKKARGLMSAYIIKNRLEDPKDIKRFDTDEYRYNTHLSNEKQWVFTRG